MFKLDLIKIFGVQNKTGLIKKNIYSSIFLKGISILLSLLIVPLTINYISAYKYGIWLTISSIVGWINFFDIGFGNGLKNRLVEVIANNKYKIARIYISTTYAILTIIISSIWLILILTSNFINWRSFLNTDKVSNSELNSIILIVITTFAIQFVLNLINTILSAFHKTYITSIINVLIQFFLLIIIFLLKLRYVGSLIGLSVSLGLVNISILTLFTIYLFSTKFKQFAPSFKYIRFKYSKDLIKVGISFFLLQIVALVYYETNNLIITKLLGPLDVTVYNLAFKYVSILTMFFTIILTPFWPAFIQARVENDFLWMESMKSKLYKTYFYMLLVCLVMILFSNLVYKIWFGNTVLIPFILTVLLSIWQILNIWNSLHSTLIYGFGKIKIQLYTSISIGVINIPITIFMCSKYGLNGVVCSQILTSLIVSWIGPFQLNKLLNKTAIGFWNA